MEREGLGDLITCKDERVDRWEVVPDSHNLWLFQYWVYQQTRCIDTAFWLFQSLVLGFFIRHCPLCVYISLCHITQVIKISHPFSPSIFFLHTVSDHKVEEAKAWDWSESHLMWGPKHNMRAELLLRTSTKPMWMGSRLLSHGNKCCLITWFTVVKCQPADWKPQVLSFRLFWSLWSLLIMDIDTGHKHFNTVMVRPRT